VAWEDGGAKARLMNVWGEWTDVSKIVLSAGSDKVVDLEGGVSVGSIAVWL